MGRSEDDIQVNYIAGFFAGLLGAMGFGGGSILIIYLTVFMSVPQITAQGMNLLFFIPCAIVSVIYNLKKKLIKYKVGIYILLGAVPGLALGAFLISNIETQILGKLFGGFLVISGIVSLFKKETNKS